MTIKEIEADIRRAFEIDRVLPYPVRPNNGRCYLGQWIVIDDTERSYDDITEDMKNNILTVSADDMKLWETVMYEWMRLIVGLPRIVVEKRCQGMGWKRIARYLYDEKKTLRVFDRTTLWRIFKDGLREIQRKTNKG